MAYSGVDIDRLRALARHIDWDVAPLLRRSATVALDTLDSQDLHAVADRCAHTLTSAASWLEIAAADLLRRASIVESAEHLGGWTATMPDRVHHLTVAQATAVLDGSYSADADADITSWISERAASEASHVAEEITAGIESGEWEALRHLSARLETEAAQPWFPEAMAIVFDSLGPAGAALLVRRLVSVPVQRYDDAVTLRFAAAFSAATNGGLSWTSSDVSSWFEHGPAGAAQLLRAPGLDGAFLEQVIATIGLDPYVYTGPEPTQGIRHSLSNGSDIWHHVGPRAGDHRAVLLDALTDHPRLAVATLGAPEVVEDLVGANWHLDEGAALGGLLATISRIGGRVSPTVTEEIRHRAITSAAGATDDVPMGLRPALAELASHHLGDFAFSLALSDVVTPIDLRPGLELPASDVRRLLHLIAEHDAAFSRLSVSYGTWVAREISRGGTSVGPHLEAVADEIGALTFALAYIDREHRTTQSELETTERLSALHLLELLASSGVALLPGATETATAFAVERILKSIKSDMSEPAPDPLLEHNAWKERMLADLEFLLAMEMNEAGLLDRRIDTSSVSRLEFLYLVEESDGPLERIMAIIEAQARRQREAIDETA